MKKVMILAAMLIVSSCASHPLMKGSVAMKIDEKNGVACLDTKNLQVGHKLTLVNNKCTKIPVSKSDPTFCQMVTVGEVEITKVLNDHYSEFQTLGDFKFQEGSILQHSK